MKSHSVHFLAGLLLWVVSCAPVGTEEFSPDPYFADLRQLETLTATTYANFEWAIREGGVDPVGIHRRARQALSAAGSDDEARRALRAFVESFGDAHFRLDEPRSEPADSGDEAGPKPSTAAGEACVALGYEEHDQSFRFDLGDDLRMVTPRGDPFPAGWFERRDGRRIGLLRLDEFGPNRYGEYCPATWEVYRSGLSAACSDWECRYGFRLQLSERLLSEIEERVRRLELKKIDALVVDISGNGGGSEWNDPVARLLTQKVLVGNERSVVRHPHWRGMLDQMAGEVEADLGREDLSDRQRSMLEEAASRLEVARTEAASPCDLSLVWERGVDELPCSILVRRALFSTGLVAVPPVASRGELAIGQALFNALDYRSRSPAWRGPLAVVIDRGTASAAEMFAALLRDNEAAILIGQRTFGVGCGYTNGGIRTVLEHSGLEVRLPDCVRHRRDGTNERAGIAPDLEVEWEDGLSPAERGVRLRTTLDQWQLGP